MSSSAISRSVQFEGIPSVVRAYQNRNVAPWAIFCNNQFMFKYQGNKIADGVKVLHDTLDAIAETNSPAVYTLKVYEDLKGGIKSNTPDDGSFNFRMHSGAIGAVSNGSNKEILDEIKGLHLRIDSITNGDDGDEPDAIGQIERVMEIPGVKEVVTGLLGMLMPGNPTAPRALAGVPQAATQQPAATDQSDQIYLSESILQSLQILLHADPQLEEHLLKLATMAEKNPGQFKMLIGML
jgi:hypothetical protein